MSVDEPLRRTESELPGSDGLDRLDTLELVELINQNDRNVAECVYEARREIALAIDRISEVFKAGGRLFYIGAGTSGRLGILDASECPPTYGVDPELVQGVIAGGREAVFQSREGAEDDDTQPAVDLQARHFSGNDILVGLSASGRTPYVKGALEYARSCGAPTVVVICNSSGILTSYADIAICMDTGPEVIAGSTRMKAGTAQKMVLNMLSTGAMVKTGRVIGNKMACMRVSCGKLRDRAVRMVCELAGCDTAKAFQALESHAWNVAESAQSLSDGVSSASNSATTFPSA